MIVPLPKPPSPGPVRQRFVRAVARCVAVSALVAFAWPAAAADDPWRLRFGAAWIDPSVGLLGDDLESDGDLGANASVERLITPRMGFELGAMVGDSSSDFSSEVLLGVLFSQELDIDFQALTGALNFHLTPGRPVDLYVGPLVAFIDFGDTFIEDRRSIIGLPDQVSAADLDGSEEFALGAQAGADFGFGGGPWALNVSAKYFETEFQASDGEGNSLDIDFDPLILGFGFSYRF